MDKILESVLDHWKSRTKTPVYGLFGFWWAIFHLEFFYVLFFIDQKDILAQKEMLKNEYLWSEFVRYGDCYFWIQQGLAFSASVVLAWFMIRWFPVTVNWAYSHGRDFELKRQIKKIEYEIKLADKRAALTKKEKAQLDDEKEIEEIKVDLKKDWQKEFVSFRDSTKSIGFDELLKCVYENKGETIWYDGDGEFVSRVPSDMLAIAEGMELIKYDSSSTRAELTDKGRHFAEWYLS